MEWYYAKQGQQQGPVDSDTLKDMLAAGELSETDLVWKEGMPEWIPAASVPELSSPAAAEEASSSALPVAPAPTPTVQAAPAQTSVSPSSQVSGEQALAQPQAGLAQGVPQATPGLAVASLVCGILGLLGAMCYGIGIFPALAGVVCGHMQMKRYKEEDSTEAGKGLAIAGLITGYLGIVGSLATIGLIVFAVFYASSVSPTPVVTP
jgi:hypothetical protein